MPKFDFNKVAPFPRTPLGGCFYSLSNSKACSCCVAFENLWKIFIERSIIK